MSIGRPMDQRIAEMRAFRTAPNPRPYPVPAVHSLALAATRHAAHSLTHVATSQSRTTASLHSLALAATGHATHSLTLVATRHSRATTAGQRLRAGYERERVGNMAIEPASVHIGHWSLVIGHFS
jgi:hypothetical protein